MIWWWNKQQQQQQRTVWIKTHTSIIKNKNVNLIYRYIHVKTKIIWISNLQPEKTLQNHYYPSDSKIIIIYFYRNITNKILWSFPYITSVYVFLRVIQILIILLCEDIDSILIFLRKINQQIWINYHITIIRMSYLHM